MGMLDFMNNMSPEQSQGLLSAASQMLQMSGPSRTPTGFGQVMGGGLQAYQQSMEAARRRKLEEEQAKQMAEMRQLQMQDMRGGLQDKATARQLDQDTMGAYRNAYRTPEQQASSLPGGPTIANAARIPEMKGGFDNDALVNQMMLINPVEGMKLKAQFAPKPKELKETTNETVDGKTVKVNWFRDGSHEIVSGMLPRDPLKWLPAGGKTVGVNEFTGAPGATIEHTQTLDSKASNARADARLNFDKAQAASMANDPDGLLPDETVSMMAEQYRAGDTSVMQNLGRGAQGAKNIIRLRSEISRQTKEAGQGGRDLAAQNAEYFGTKAGQRSAGTRIANVEMASYEAESLMPLARDASAAVARSGFLPFGKGQVMFNEQTNDPQMRQFAAANNALVNVYSRAISPSGVPTVHDKEHAREMISTAIDHKAYSAVIDQMQKEITAARAAPKQVRKAFNDAVTGRGEHDAEALPEKAKPAAPVMDAKPAANMNNKGRKLRDNSTGKEYVSNGMQWVEVK